VNPVYELLATASADGTARLWRDGPGDFADADDDEKADEALAARMAKTKRRGGDGDARDEGGPVETYGARGGGAVCGVAWSAADPWSFASLEGDGTVAMCFVPRAEKYKILL
jgi:WD40 repeat protein